MTLLELIQQQNLQNNTYDYICQELNNKPLINNPSPIGQVPKEAKISDFLVIIQTSGSPTEDLAIVSSVAELIKVGDAIGSHLGLSTEGNIESLVNLLEANGLSESAVANIRARLAETEDNPNYQPKILGQSLAEENGLGRIKPEDVQYALNR